MSKPYGSETNQTEGNLPENPVLDNENRNWNAKLKCGARASANAQGQYKDENIEKIIENDSTAEQQLSQRNVNKRLFKIILKAVSSGSESGILDFNYRPIPQFLYIA